MHNDSSWSPFWLRVLAVFLASTSGNWSDDVRQCPSDAEQANVRIAFIGFDAPVLSAEHPVGRTA